MWHVHDDEELCILPNNKWDMIFDRVKKKLKVETGE